MNREPKGLPTQSEQHAINVADTVKHLQAMRRRSGISIEVYLDVFDQVGSLIHFGQLNGRTPDDTLQDLREALIEF